MPIGIPSSLQRKWVNFNESVSLFQCLSAFLPRCNKEPIMCETDAELFQCLSAFLPRCNTTCRWWGTKPTRFNAYRHSFLVATATLTPFSPTLISFNAYRHSFLVATHNQRLQSRSDDVSMPIGIPSSLQLMARQYGLTADTFQCLSAFLPRCNLLMGGRRSTRLLKFQCLSAFLPRCN